MEVPRRAALLITPFAAAAALLAFAANSLLCRAALGSSSIDAFSFSVLRVASGALALLLLQRATARRDAPVGRAPAPDWRAGALLALYAVPFSWAYTRLETGTGAFLLFAAVQATLLLAAVRLGERPSARQWFGIALALGGIAALAAAGPRPMAFGWTAASRWTAVATEAPIAAAAMVLAGIAWGLYTLRGRHAADPLRSTAGNFATALPWVGAAALPVLTRLEISARGALLAVASGAFASALGYVAWYRALRGLSATRAAAIQLAVPILAAAGGVVLLGEPLAPRLLIAGSTIVFGVALASIRRPAPPPRAAQSRTAAYADGPSACASQIARTL
jgi:drug/metabolite transporter (DMT)-like permease